MGLVKYYVKSVDDRFTYVFVHIKKLKDTRNLVARICMLKYFRGLLLFEKSYFLYIGMHSNYLHRSNGDSPAVEI